MDQPKIDDETLAQIMTEAGLGKAAVVEAMNKVESALEKLGLSGRVEFNIRMTVFGPNDRELAVGGLQRFRGFNGVSS